MVGKYNRDTSSLTATPSTVTSSPAAFGRWAFGIGQPRRDRRGRTGIVKGRSVRSGGNVLTTLSGSASGIFAICQQGRAGAAYAPCRWLHCAYAISWRTPSSVCACLISDRHRFGKEPICYEE